MVELEFITYEDPKQARRASNKRTVKSQAARHHWARYASSRLHQSRQNRGERERKHVKIDLMVRRQSTSTSIGTSPSNESESSKSRDDQLQVKIDVIGSLGAGRVDPFRTYPVAWQTYFPEVIDHYITNMAVPIPEIDGSPKNKGSLRKTWFPLVLTDPATFQAILLLSASHLYSIQKTPNVAINLLCLKDRTINEINNGLTDPRRSYTDAMIGAVAKMCSYEAMYGNMESYRVHMMGLKGMVDRRGGLEGLGLEGLLGRICVWIDLNAAFLNGTERFWDKGFNDFGGGVVDEIEPNPGQFIGSWED